MSTKRRLFIYKSSPGCYDAQLEGYTCIGNGGTELDAMKDVMNQVDELLQHDLDTVDAAQNTIADVLVVPVDKPLPHFEAAMCSGENHTINLERNGKRYTAILSPVDDPKNRHRTRSSAVSAVCAVMYSNRHLLRRGNRLYIISGETRWTHPMYIAFRDRRYVATLEPMIGASTERDPIDAACRVLTQNPQAIYEGHRLNIFFPDELKEADHEHI